MTKEERKNIINQMQADYSKQWSKWRSKANVTATGMSQIEFDSSADCPKITNRTQLEMLGVLTKDEPITEDNFDDVLDVLKECSVFIMADDSTPMHHIISTLNIAINDEVPANWGFNNAEDHLDLTYLGEPNEAN